MLKSVILNLIKFGLAFGLIYWLVQSGKLDMSLIKQVISAPHVLFMIMALMLADMGIAAFRWKMILEFNQAIKIKILKVFKANWVGLFFNCVLPGAVSGDLIKIFYIKDENENWSKKFLFASAFLDRILGLFGLISVGAIACLISYGYLTGLSPKVATLVHFNLLLFAFVVSSFVAVFFFQDLPLKISAVVKSKVNFLSNIMEKLEVMWKDLCAFKHNLLIYLLISMVVQCIAMIIFWMVISPYTEIPFEFRHATTIFPIGMISIAIPISPAGLGVGHFVFEELFALLGFKNGANLFNIYFIILIMTNLTGVIPYLLHSGKKVKISEISEDQI